MLTQHTGRAPVQGGLAYASIRPKEIAIVVLALVGWATVFTAGFVIDSRVFPGALASHATLSLLQKTEYWFIVITTFTLTNVAILCCSGCLTQAGVPPKPLLLGWDTGILKCF